MLNSTVLIGRLCAEPELRFSKQGVAVCKFTLAVARKYKKDETDFIDIVCFQKTAENSAQYMSKGSLCAVEGAIQTRTYENQEGRKVKVFEVLANDVRFLDSKKSGAASSSPAPARDEWNDVGREVTIEDVDLSGDVPF